jgi:hypothetical protein
MHQGDTEKVTIFRYILRTWRWHVQILWWAPIYQTTDLSHGTKAGNETDPIDYCARQTQSLPRLQGGVNSSPRE